jgi:hypothetical protein
MSKGPKPSKSAKDATKALLDMDKASDKAAKKAAKGK